MRIRVNSPQDEVLRRLLAGHPGVEIVGAADADGLEFQQGTWDRRVLVGDSNCEIKGLVEMMDNNPMVCADVVSVPSAGATLALIALGPVAKAGLILEEPTLLANIPLDAEDIGLYLATEGWQHGVLVETENRDLDNVAAMTAIAPVSLAEGPDAIGDLYEECFGRSFFVRPDQTSDWHVGLVKGTPLAVYRLLLSVEESVGLLTVRVMADLDGKCGVAQVVHAMNVMAGFEESLGLG